MSHFLFRAAWSRFWLFAETIVPPLSEEELEATGLYLARAWGAS